LRDNPEISVILPTLNEAENIDAVITRILSVMATSWLRGEILVVDGGSSDNTRTVVKNRQKEDLVRLVTSNAQGGLAGDVLHGARFASGRVVVVMDADLSHPPESIPALVAPVLEDTHDMVIGSRYVKDGRTRGWPWTRRIVSKAATALAWPLVNVKDPMSGFFATTRDRLLELGREAAGFKLALEILGQAGDSFRVKEVPIEFRERESGESKLGPREAVAYLKQLVLLAGGTISTGHTLRFGLVGLLGLIIDVTIFNLLFSLGANMVASHMLSFAAATIFNYALNARWAFADTGGSSQNSGLRRYIRYLSVCLLALFLRGAVLSALVNAAHWHPRLAILLAIAAATAVNFTGTAFFIFPQTAAQARRAIRWRVFALCVAGYAILLRFAFSGVIDLIPEEAYYWMYSQHLALGYLDHPPMVSWLIWLSTAVFGNQEFAVRLPAFFCWAAAAFFMFRLGQSLFDKTAAFVTLAFMALLPVYFGIGIIMTPDAPLYAAWAGCLYFLERALFAGKGRAWWGAGVCLGLGMLSKYTIALLGPAALIFVIADRNSRQWLIRPEPYVGIFLALLMFSPVILWNANHDWASFAFQGPRRWSGAPEVSLHVLIEHLMILLTPIGLAGIVAVFMPWRALGPLKSRAGRIQNRTRLFGLIFTLVPFSVFVLYSLQDNPKLNWTGPVWLAALPLLAWLIMAGKKEAGRFLGRAVLGAWQPVFVILLLLYGSGMYYILLGLPGLPPLNEMPVPAAWQEMGSTVEAIERNVQARTGQQPLVVGTDKYFISSQLAFYDPGRNGPKDISGQHLFGKTSLMWSKWSPGSLAIGKNIIMVDFEKDELQGARIEKSFTGLSSIRRQIIRKNGEIFGYFYYRIGYDYKKISGRALHDIG